MKNFSAKRVTSPDGRTSVKIYERDDGQYSLRRFETKFDAEEGRDYEVELRPAPDGIFGAPEEAQKEAERIVLL